MLNNLSVGTIFMLIKMTLIILIIVNVINRFKNADEGSTEYSYAAEPPVQFRLSHLSRRSEPL